MTSATGANASSGAPGGASVTRPDSLQAVFGRAAKARIAARHGSSSPLPIGGLPAWSRISVSSGTSLAAYVAAAS